MGMPVEISYDDAVGDVAACGRKVAILPEVIGPIGS